MTDISQRYPQWFVLIEEQEKSGQTQKEFCEQRNIRLSKFVYYRGLLKKAGKDKHKIEPAFKPVKLVNKENTSAIDARILLPNGFQLTFPCQIEPARVKQLIEVLLSC